MTERKMEIERKYLLKGMPPIPAGTPAIEMEQGYVRKDSGERYRLRRSVDGRGGTTWIRSSKKGSGLVREETEEAIAREDFEREWVLTKGRRLKKRRHLVTSAGFLWEIDEFLGMDLVLAEVEMETVDDRPEMPKWLAAWVVREVTEEEEYRNSVLAR